jgi:hypothetical protein
MANSIEQIVIAIDSLTTLDSAEDLTRLQELVDLYFTQPEAGDFLEVWFQLYERFPVDNSNGIFWSILHGIETYHPNSDRLVVSSVRRQPSEFPVMMVNRLLNAGIQQVGEVNLLELLDLVATNRDCSQLIRENAKNFLVDSRSKQLSQ